MEPITAMAVAQGVGGLIQTVSGVINSSKYAKKLKAYQTPEEIGKVLNMALSNMGNTSARDFQVGQLDRTFGQLLGSAERLGANPNDLSSLFNEKVNSLIKIGSEFHANNLKQFSDVIAAYNLVADNKAAEWKSQQDIIKDKMQAAGAEKAAGIQNIGNAISTGISAESSGKIMDLYKQIEDLKKGKTSTV